MKKVLIAEDDAVFLSLLKSELQKYNDRFEVLTAEDGQEAIQLLNNNQISLLITDIRMPRVDGLNLLAYVNENFPFIPCFVMTAYETPELRKRLPRDIRRFFRKPFPANQLSLEILKIFDQDIPKELLYGISVGSFMMMIEMEKRTCILEVKLPDGDIGLFYFEKGGLYNAVCKDQKGRAAALKFVGRKRAKFSFKPLPEKKITKLEKMILTDLVQEAASSDNKTAANKDNTSQPNGLNLPGVFVTSDKTQMGQMTVTNLSITDIRMLFKLKPEVIAGTKLEIEFDLDDKLNSHVAREVTVTHIEDYIVDAEFRFKEHYDRLGPYLHFNGLVNKNW
jgi:CheY-like chemotaxis protein